MKKTLQNKGFDGVQAACINTFKANAERVHAGVILNPRLHRMGGVQVRK